MTHNFTPIIVKNINSTVPSRLPRQLWMTLASCECRAALGEGNCHSLWPQIHFNFLTNKYCENEMIFKLWFKLVCQVLWIETNLLWTFSQMTSSECRAAVRPEEKQLAAVCDHKYIRTKSNIWTIMITKVSGQIHLDEYILKNVFRQSGLLIYWDKYAETWSFLMIIWDVSNLDPSK